MYTLECELVTAASLRDAFAVFENPYNLERITPPWLSFRIITPNLKMRAGAEIDYTFRSLGIPMTWRTLITEYDPPHLFVDEAVSSPYSLWRHRHTFHETEEGTIVADRVDYALPLGPIGRIAHSLVVRRQLESIFEYRQSAIAALLGDIISVRPPAIHRAA
jgi:hypothetical protein